MSQLNFEDSQNAQSRFGEPFRLVLGVSTLTVALVFGSTLASNINLNSGAPVEFGQGVSQFTACDDQVNVTPVSSFSNDENNGFKFSGIRITDLDGTTQIDAVDKGCAGETLTIKSFDSIGNLFTPTYSISLDSDGSFSSSDGDTDGFGTEGDIDSSVELTFDEALISAESIYRITIETGSFTNIAFLTTTAIDVASQLNNDFIDSPLPSTVTSTPVGRIYIYPGSGTVTAVISGPGFLGTSTTNGFARALILSREPNSPMNLYLFSDGTSGQSTISITVSGQSNTKIVNFASP